jgi:hypothetical protein
MHFAPVTFDTKFNKTRLMDKVWFRGSPNLLQWVLRRPPLATLPAGVRYRPPLATLPVASAMCARTRPMDRTWFGYFTQVITDPMYNKTKARIIDFDKKIFIINIESVRAGIRRCRCRNGTGDYARNRTQHV